MDKATQDITIESLGAQGDGVGRWQGQPVYVPKALPGEVWRVRLAARKGQGWQADSGEMLVAAAERAVPPCAHYQECGGCQLQHMDVASQSRFKQEKLERALHYAGVSWAQAEYLPLARYEDGRRRVEFTLQQRKGQVRLAYQEEGSHRKVAVVKCPVLLPVLQRVMERLPQALSKLPDVKLVSGLRLTAVDSGVDGLLYLSGMPTPALMEDCAAMARELGFIRLSLQEEGMAATPVAVLGPVTMRFAEEEVTLPPEAFLQASPEAQKRLQAEVLAGLEGVGAVADLFCGLGTYAVPLAKAGHEVMALESDGGMVGMLRQLAQRPAMQGRLTVVQRDLFALPLRTEELKSVAGVAINPPRAGAKTQSEHLAKSPTVQKIVMVSCNPASFARDAAALQAGGFALTRLVPIDQFPHTTHLEVVGVFAR